MGLFQRFNKLKLSNIKGKLPKLPKFKKPNLGRLGETFKNAGAKVKDKFKNLKLKPSADGKPPKFKPWIKNKWSTLKDSLPKNFDELKQLQSSEALEKIRNLASTKSYGTYMKLGAATFAAYFMADTVSLFTDSLIPDPPPVPAKRVYGKKKQDNFQKYQAIINRHIFSSEGLIPDQNTNLATGPARKTTLPFQLVGTVVLKDELKSIAAIEDQSDNLVFPVRIDDTLNGKATITKIEHLKVFFINKRSGQLEYVEIIDDLKGMPTIAPPSTSLPKTDDAIKKSGSTNFNIDRSFVEKSMSNLGEILQQARAIPNFQNGKLDGYKLIQIVPGSIYDKLGLKNYDVICGVNGDPITNPGQAFELFNDLKSVSHLELCVKRGGRTMTMNYDID